MAHPLKCHPFKLTQIFVHTQFILIVQLARVLLFTRVLLFNPKHKLLVLLPPTHCSPPAIPYIMYLLPHYESPSLMPITFVTLHLMLIVKFHPPDIFRYPTSANIIANPAWYQLEFKSSCSISWCEL